MDTARGEIEVGVADQDSDVQGLLADLTSPVEDVRRRTLFQLGRSLDLRAIPHVKKIAADDPSQEARYLARKLLALYEAKRPESKTLIRPAVVQPAEPLNTPAAIKAALASRDPATRAAGLKACADMKDASLLPALLTRVGADEHGHPFEPVPEVRSMIPLALAHLAGASQITGIAVFLEDADPRVRANTLAALQGIGDPACWPYIVRCVQDPDHRVKTAAISTLAKIGRINLIKCCQAMIERAGNQYWHKDSAISLLAQSGVPEAFPLLEASLSDPIPGIAQKALKGLQKLASKGFEPAMQALEQAARLGISDEIPEDFLSLEQAPPNTRNGHAGALQKELTKAAYEKADRATVLDRIKNEKDIPTLVGLVNALQQAPSEDCLPTLLEVSAHGAEEVRDACVGALLAVGTPSAIEGTIALLADPSAVVVSRAILALKARPEIDLSKPIEDLANHTSAARRRSAILVIAELPQEKFMPVLEKLAQDEDADVKSLASAALSKLGNASSEPLRPAVSPDQQDEVEAVILLDLESEIESVRRSAIFNAAKLGEKAVRVLPVLKRIASTDAPELAYLARKCLHALQQQGEEVAAARTKSTGQTRLIALEGDAEISAKLQSRDPALRASTLRAVALKKSPSLLPFVVARADPAVEPDPELRSIQPFVIATVAGKDGINDILRYLDDPDPRVRANTLDCLSRLGEPSVWVRVVAALRDPDHRVMTCAAQLLGAVGKLNLLRLCEFMMRPESPPNMRDSAMYALTVAKLPESACSPLGSPTRSRTYA